MTTVIRGSDNFDSADNGRVLGVTTYTNSTRQVLSILADITMASFSVEKKSSTSVLVIQGSMAGWGNYSGLAQQGWKLGSGTEFQAQTIMYEGTTNGKCFPTTAVIAGHTTTGVQTMVFRFYSNSGGFKPFLIYNPNTTDDSRLGQTASVFTVTEVEV